MATRTSKDKEIKIERKDVFFLLLAIVCLVLIVYIAMITVAYNNLVESYIHLDSLFRMAVNSDGQMLIR